MVHQESHFMQEKQRKLKQISDHTTNLHFSGWHQHWRVAGGVSSFLCSSLRGGGWKGTSLVCWCGKYSDLERRLKQLEAFKRDQQPIFLSMLLLDHSLAFPGCYTPVKPTGLRRIGPLRWRGTFSLFHPFPQEKGQPETGQFLEALLIPCEQILSFFLLHKHRNQ